MYVCECDLIRLDRYRSDETKFESELSLIGSFRNWEGRIESSVISKGALFYFIKYINKLEEQNLLAIFFDQDFRELTLYCET